MGHICYREGNLIVIEKCYSWQNCCETDVYVCMYVYTTDIDVWMKELSIGGKLID